MKHSFMMVCLFAGLSCSALALSSSPRAPKGTEWESEQELGLGKLPPRAWFGHFPDAESAKGILMQTSPWHRFLDSETDWRFRWSRRPEERPAGFFRPDYDVSGWDIVKVPCSWQAAGIRANREPYGKPIYVNQGYIWTTDAAAAAALAPKVRGGRLPEDWTFGPEDNPVGSYRREFTVPEAWKGMNVYLQFDGVESFFYLWINGRYVGFSKNSRNAAAFDVTRWVRPGGNTLAVEVYRNSDGSYLEAQDMFRLSGIMRHVRLYAAPRNRIADVKIDTHPAVRGDYAGSWRVSAIVECSLASEAHDSGGCAVRARVFDAKGREITLSGETVGVTHHSDNTPYADINFSLVPLSFAVSRPRLWSAEEPNLYTLVLEMVEGHRGEKPETLVEAIGFQLGFREVEIRRSANPMDHVFLFNGKPIKLKGVNRGECHPLYGHYVPDDQALRDLELIRRANMNHIRCSHFPQGEYFYYLCNKFGLYLMDEANLESHGCQYAEHSLSHREEWAAAHRDRVRAMFEWEKNEPSVILWSLGNEAGPGRAFKECYEDLHGRDLQGRPINWERNNRLADIGSSQYPEHRKMWNIAAGTNSVRYPYHVNEYAHDRLNCPNDLADYQAAIESSDRIMGAAIWDFADQALLKKVENEVEKRGGGGEKSEAWIDGMGADFGEKPVEAAGGDGILEGIVRADRTPEPSYWEAKHAFQPYAFRKADGCRSKVAGDCGDLEIESKNFFVDSSAVVFEWMLLAEGRPTGIWKPLDIGSPLAPRERRVVSLPDEALRAARERRTAIRLRARQVAAANLLPADWTVAEEQMELSSLAASVDAIVPIASQKDVAPTSDAFETNASTLAIGKWRFSKKTGTLLDGGMTLDAFRYPVGYERVFYMGPGPNPIYRECLREGLRYPEATAVRFTEPHRDGADWVFETEQLWRGRVREDCTDVGKGGSKIVPLGPTTETNTAFRAVNRWRVCADGSLDLDTTFTREGRRLDGPSRFAWAWPSAWNLLPRLGWRFEFPCTGAIEYEGCGPCETYANRRHGFFPEVRRVGSVGGMGQPYARNQDFGNRTGVRRVTVCDTRFTVAARAEPFEMAVSPWSAGELVETVRPDELTPARRTLLTVYSVGPKAGKLQVKFRK